MFLTLFLACGILAFNEARITQLGCTVNINKDLGTPQPLYFYHNTTNFVTTTSGFEFTLKSQEKIDIFCSDSFRYPYVNETLIEATCISGNQFKIKNKSAQLIDAKCNDYPIHTTRITDRNCVAGKTIEIGFNVRGIWLPTLEICHDHKAGATRWAHNYLKPNCHYRQENQERIQFIQGDFYPGIKPNELYYKLTVRKTAAQILGSVKLAEQIFDTNIFLTRGHLAAKSDYVFGAHQLSTFYYINVAPQWNTFNGGNWRSIEYGVRQFLMTRNIETEVYTGTYGFLSYADINGKHQTIYLAYNSKKPTKNRIPVPQFYYKVLIAESINAGIVFIGVNDPYATIESIENDRIICPDVGNKVNYIEWDRMNITLGYSYACSVNDFVKVVKDLPSLPRIKNLLI